MQTDANGSIKIMDPARLVTIEDVQKSFTDVHFSGTDTFSVGERGLVISDPTYLADVYRPNDDPLAAYIRQHAVIMHDFGGDVACPVWWQNPYIVLPISSMWQGEITRPSGTLELAEEVACDSGSFCFLPLQEMAEPVYEHVRCTVDAEGGVLLNPPIGTYRVYYYQHGEFGDRDASFRRDVIAQLEHSAK